MNSGDLQIKRNPNDVHAHPQVRLGHTLCGLLGNGRCCFLLFILVVLGISFSALSTEVETDITGNEYFGTGFIRNSLPRLKDDAGDRDIDAWRSNASSIIARMYHESGFLDARVSDERSRLPDHQKNTDRITFSVREGNQYHIDTILVLGADSLDTIIVPEQMRNRSGEPYKQEFNFRDQQSILSAYGRAGHVHAVVTDSVTVDTTTNMVSVFYRVQPKWIVIFDTLLVHISRPGEKGLKPLTKETKLRRLVTFERGDTVQTEKLDRITDNILSSRLFTYVRLRDTLLDSANLRSALILEAEERAPGHLTLDFFYETQYGPGTHGNLNHANIAGNMHEIGVRTTLSLNKQSIEFLYARPFFGALPLRFDNRLNFAFLQIGDIHAVKGTPPFNGDYEISDIAKISRSFRRWLRGAATTEASMKRVFTSESEYLEGVNLTLTLQGFVDFLDDPIQPTKGWRTSLIWGTGAEFTPNSDTLYNGVYTWIESNSAAFYPIIKQLILAGRLDGGRFFGNAGLNADRFFLGGPRSVRSFGFNELCPGEDTTGECLGKNLTPAFYLVSAEIRFSPFDFGYVPTENVLNYLIPAELVPFVDYGKVWNVTEPFEKQPSGEGVAYGIGLRYPLFNIFSLRLDFAWGFDGNQNRAFAWVLDLAQAF